jgi:hypothetical protein
VGSGTGTVHYGVQDRRPVPVQLLHSAAAVGAAETGAWACTLPTVPTIHLSLPRGRNLPAHKMQSCGDTGPRRCNYHSKGDLRYDRGEGCWLLVCRWCHQRCCTGITSAALAQPTSRWTGRARACTRSLPSFTWCTTTCSSSPSSAWPPPAPAPPPPPLYPRALASCSLSSESRAFPRWRCLMHCLVAAACGTQVRGSVHLPDPRQPEDRHHRHPLPPLPQT